MPRASTTNDNEETPKRAPRKRAVRRVVAKSETPVRRTRQPRVAEESRQDEEAVSSSVRRAPTRLGEEIVNKRSGTKKLIGAASFFILMLGTGAFVGMSDDGQIDVNAQMNKANSANTSGEPNDTVNAEDGQFTVPVQNTPPPAAISGLQPAGADLIPAETPPTPVASTTEEIATTTSETEANQEESSVEETDTTENAPTLE